MSGVTESADESADHARRMAELYERQAVSIEVVRGQMETISGIVSRTLQTAVESGEIAREVSGDANKMDEIVRAYR